MIANFAFLFKGSEVAAQLNKKKASILAREKRVTKMIFLMVFAFMSAWSGYAILSLLRLHGSGFSDYVIGIVMIMAKSGACLNIVIFILMHQEVIEKWCLDLNIGLFLIFPI